MLKKSFLSVIFIGIFSMAYTQESLDALIQQLKNSDNQQIESLSEKIIGYEKSAIKPLQEFAKTNPEFKRIVDSLLSQIQRQWEGNGNGVFWEKDFQSALIEAKHTGKLLLLLQTTGKFSEEFC